MVFISKLIGIIAFILMLVGIVPLLGWLNWVVMPIALIGFFFGIFGKNNGGMILNGLVLIISLIRLSLGGGII